MNKETFIQKYLHEELTDTEYVEFVALIESDPQFAENVQIESILYAKHKKNLKAEFLKNSTIADLKDSTQTKQNQVSKFRKIFPLIRNIAAVFILAIIGYYLFTDQKTTSFESDNLASHYLSQIHQPPPRLMSDSEVNNDDWTIAIDSYRQGKYEVTAELIQNIDDRTNQQNLYLALSQLYSTDQDINIEKAISSFKTILKSNSDHHTDEAQWFLSLAYLLNKDEALAKESLAKIISNNSWNAEKAAVLLKEINK